MNILHFIGNGFDKNLGLPTSYPEFYAWYLAQPSKSKIIQNLKSQLKADRDENKNNWSDLEIWIGSYSTRWNNRDEVYEAYIDLNDSLKQYLQKVCELKSTELPAYKKTFISNLRQPFAALSRNNLRIVQSHAGTERPYNHRFITFNYTPSIETLLGDIPYTRGSGHVIESNRASSPTVFVSTIRHIHGDFESPELILGVNDSSQLANDSFRGDPTIESMLVKPVNTQLKEDLVDEDCESLIKKSDVFSIYGCSMGKTDLKWWRLLFSQLLQRECILICYIYSPVKPTRTTDIVMLSKTLTDTLRAHFLDLLSSEDNAETLTDQIMHRTIVLPHYKMFDFSK